MSLATTPSANRLHIGVFGRRNSGKSSLLNAIANQNVSVISPIAGTTTDPVYKAMELHGLGPCMLIDTAGFDDVGELGELRIDKTREALEKTDVAVVVFSGNDFSAEAAWIKVLRDKNRPIVAVVNKSDLLSDPPDMMGAVKKKFGLDPLLVSAKERTGIPPLLEAIARVLPEDWEKPDLTGNLVRPGDLVLLVMPQDIQAPKGRLILPQVQVLRNLLDKRCIPVCVTTDRLSEALAALSHPPALIITDSQVFPAVYAKKPAESRLTSFSILMAMNKGDMAAYAEGAGAIDRLTGSSRVLISEACTHSPMEEDIGRVKLPQLLRARAGETLAVEVVSGPDFPEDLRQYDLIIQCGACMFNRRYVLSRIRRAQEQGVPITNYGVALAKLSGLLDHVCYE